MRDLFIKYFGRLLALLGCTTMVMLTPASENASTSGVQHIFINESSKTFYTSADGKVEEEITIYPYEKTELFFLQCDDVDGAQNGTYAHEEKLISAHEAEDFHVEMTPID